MTGAEGESFEAAAGFDGGGKILGHANSRGLQFAVQPGIAEIGFEIAGHDVQQLARGVPDLIIPQLLGRQAQDAGGNGLGGGGTQAEVNMADHLAGEANGTEHVLAHEAVQLVHVHGLQRERQHGLKGLGERQREGRAHGQQQGTANAVAHQRLVHGAHRVFGFVLRARIGHAQQPRAQSRIFLNDADNLVHAGILPGHQLGQARHAFRRGGNPVTAGDFLVLIQVGRRLH